MGQAITRLLLRNHYDIAVWNRTTSRADEMVKLGAHKYDTVSELLKANRTIILSLTDVQLMFQLLNNEAPLLKGRTFINLSSDTPENARKANGWVSNRGAFYLTGTIMVEPHMLGNEESFVFYSGDKAVFESLMPVFEVLGVAEYLGGDPGTAQLFSIALLNILFTSATGVSHSLALLKKEQVKLALFEPYLNSFLAILPTMLDGTVQQSETGQYDGALNNMNMMYAAMTHIAQASKDADVNTEITDTVAEIFRRTIVNGHGKDGLASIIEAIK